MRAFEPDWVRGNFWTRPIMYVLVPLLVSWIGLYEQSTALGRHYLYPYLESSIFCYSPAATTSVERYFKYTKVGKKHEILAEDNVVPAEVAEPDTLPVVLTPEAREQGWDHIGGTPSVSMNSHILAAWLQSNVYRGKSIWRLVWFFCWRYFGCLLVCFSLFYAVRNRREILRWIIVRWKAYQEQRNRIQIQSPIEALSLPASPKPAPSAERQETSLQQAIQKKPKATPRWTPSMWVDRSKMQADDEESR
jgi:hypothetical protein